MTCWNELLLRPCYYAVEDGIEMVPERREKLRLGVTEAFQRNSKKLPYILRFEFWIQHQRTTFKTRIAGQACTRTLLTRHGSSGVAAASVDRHNCGEEWCGSVRTTRSRWWSTQMRPNGGRPEAPFYTLTVPVPATDTMSAIWTDLSRRSSLEPLSLMVMLLLLPPLQPRSEQPRLENSPLSLPLSSFSYFSLCRRSKSKASSAIFSRSIDQGLC